MLDFLWHSVWAWIGLGGLTIIGLGVVAYLFPTLRVAAVEVAGAILAATAIYAKGASDARMRDKARQAAAEAKSIADAKADRAAAERDLANGVPDGGDRDK